MPPISHYGESYEAEIKFCSGWLWGERRWKAVQSNDTGGKCVFLNVCVLWHLLASPFLYEAAFLCKLKCFFFLIHALVGLYYRPCWKCSVGSWRTHTGLLISSKLPVRLPRLRYSSSYGLLSAAYLVCLSFIFPSSFSRLLNWSRTSNPKTRTVFTTADGTFVCLNFFPVQTSSIESNDSLWLHSLC